LAFKGSLVTLRFQDLLKLLLFLEIAIIMTSCTTAWKSEGTFCKTTQSKLVLNSSTSGKVYISGKYIGDVPATAVVEYCTEFRRETRNVSYWITQPAESTMFTFLSLGLYVPFSIIPVDVQTRLIPTGRYLNNQFLVKVERPDSSKWNYTYNGKGEDVVRLSTE